MNEAIKRFKFNTEECNRLEVMASILTLKSPNHWRYYVSDTYFDFGQDWIWTTVLCQGDKWGGYQALNPRKQEKVIFGDVNDFFALADEILDGDFCPDRLEKEA